MTSHEEQISEIEQRIQAAEYSLKYIDMKMSKYQKKINKLEDAKNWAGKTILFLSIKLFKLKTGF